MLTAARAAGIGRAVRLAVVACAASLAQSAATPLPPDPWPRVLDLANAQVLVYQPQVGKWENNRIEFRAALAVKADGAKGETFDIEIPAFSLDSSYAERTIN